MNSERVLICLQKVLKTFETMNKRLHFCFDNSSTEETFEGTKKNGRSNEMIMIKISMFSCARNSSTHFGSMKVKKIKLSGFNREKFNFEFFVLFNLNISYQPLSECQGIKVNKQTDRNSSKKKKVNESHFLRDEFQRWRKCSKLEF